MPLFYQPLFNSKWLAQRAGNQPTPPDHKRLLHDWAATIRDGSIRKQKETELRGPFIQRFFVELLGYRPFGHGAEWTINDEKRTGSGSADTALGIFRRDLLHSFRRRVLTDLAPGGTTAKLTTRLSDWPALDFKAFHDEFKKQFKQPIPLAERDEWQARFEADKARVTELAAEIARCEKEVDVEVYRLFDLTADEIALIEGGV